MNQSFHRAKGRWLESKTQNRPKTFELGRFGSWLVAFAFCLLIVLPVIPGDRLKAFSAGVIAVFSLVAIIVAIRRLAPEVLTPIFFISSQIIPAIFFTLGMATFDEWQMAEHPMSYILGKPYATVLAFVTPSVGFLMFFCVKRLLLPRNTVVLSFRAIGKELPPHFGSLLILCALFQFSLWITTDVRIIDSLPAYFLRIVSRSVGLVPFAVGYWAFRFKMATRVWTVGFLVSICLAFLTGSRGYAFMPLIPFLLGLFMGIETWTKRLKTGLLLAPFLGAAFILAGLIGQIRLETGRLGISDIGKVGVDQIVAAGKIRLESGGGGVQEEGSHFGGAVARLVAWPNIAVPIMTPEIVPYRGFSELDEEFLALFELTRFTGKVYWSNVMANEYGFIVNEQTSVEFGIVADGASRAGWLGAVGYGFAAAAGLAALEWCTARMFRRRPGVFILCLCSLGGAAAYDMVRTGIFSSLRIAFTAVAVFWVMLPIVDRWAQITSGQPKFKPNGR